MADSDDTSKPTRPRRNQSKNSATATNAASPADTNIAWTPRKPPRTLEEAIENARTLLLQVRGMLHCLSEVLLYADDDDSVLHAEVAQAASEWVNETAGQLDLVTLQPLIDALRRRDEPPRNDEPESGKGGGLYQVREPTLVYSVSTDCP